MTTREQALKWWKSFGAMDKVGILAKHKVHNHRRLENLTGSEIEEVWRKEVETTENKYLDRLRQEYKLTTQRAELENSIAYNAMRLFCLDTDLIPFNDIEVMEMEVNNEIL